MDCLGQCDQCDTSTTSTTTSTGFKHLPFSYGFSTFGIDNGNEPHTMINEERISPFSSWLDMFFSSFFTLLFTLFSFWLLVDYAYRNHDHHNEEQPPPKKMSENRDYMLQDCREGNDDRFLIFMFSLPYYYRRQGRQGGRWCPLRMLFFFFLFLSRLISYLQIGLLWWTAGITTRHHHLHLQLHLHRVDNNTNGKFVGKSSKFDKSSNGGNWRQPKR